MVIREEQNVVRAVNFDFQRRSEKMMLKLFELAEAAKMSRPDLQVAIAFFNTA